MLTEAVAEQVAAPCGTKASLRLHVARVGERTRIVDLETQGPLQVLRALHLDEANPDLASVIVCTPSGGVLQGDRFEMDIRVGPGARLHLDAQSATRLYAMPDAAAVQRVNVQVESGGFVECVLDPYVPYAHSEFRQLARWEVAEDATAIVGEVVAPGREARGEWFACRLFSSVLEVRRPGGGLLFRDACLVDQGHEGPGGGGAMGSLYVVAPGFESSTFAALAEAAGEVGWSELPNRGGAWVKVLGEDTREAQGVVTEAWRLARRAVLGAGPPPRRRG